MKQGTEGKGKKGAAMPSKKGKAKKFRVLEGKAIIPRKWRRLEEQEILRAGDRFGYSDEDRGCATVVDGLSGTPVMSVGPAALFYAIRRIRTPKASATKGSRPKASSPRNSKVTPNPQRRDAR